MDPQDVAHFLYKGEGLNKTAIGKLLLLFFLLIETLLNKFIFLCNSKY